ncbi:MAG: M48 family metallopeptidase [Candidatus Eisenbacteria bacterium]|jgi:hypothetical protein|nr:M48 family metallopeptidase [Candidatus Eisenbacteria bacterium]
MDVSEDDVRNSLARWQDTLRLRDWDIDVEIMGSDWGKSGDIRADEHTKTAMLMINRRPRCTNLDELVVHELVHLKLWGLDRLVEELLELLYDQSGNEPQKAFAHGRFMDVLEPTVEDLTKALLAAAGSPVPLSFDRARLAPGPGGMRP